MRMSVINSDKCWQIRMKARTSLHYCVIAKRNERNKITRNARQYIVKVIDSYIITITSGGGLVDSHIACQSLKGQGSSQ